MSSQLRIRLVRTAVGSLAGTALALASACAGPADEEFVYEPVDEYGNPLTFDRNNLLSDADFTNSSTLSAAEIQAFLEHTHCGNRSTLADYKSNGKTAAQAIYDAATQNHLNPVLFLARLQTESSAICRPASAALLDKAFGCGCPDNAPCSPAFKGFDKQVQCAARAFRSYLDDLEANGETVAGWAVGRKKNSLDPLSVTPANAATAALYTYTPWVYNGGNHLHWQIWHAIVDYLNGQGMLTPDSAPQPQPRPAGDQNSQLPPGGCHVDEDCNHGATNTGVVCSNSGPERNTCIEGCHSDLDCPLGSTCDTTASPHWQCTSPYPKLGTPCQTDDDCNGGAYGTGRVCGASTKTCLVGCHDDSDCAGGAVCDTSLKTWACVRRLEIGDPCTSDAECHGGIGGTQRVCGNSKTCIDACHSDWDCPENLYCSHDFSPWACSYSGSQSGAGTPTAQSDGCPVLSFPSGVKLQTKKDAALTAVYRNHLGPDDKAPECFIDVNDLRDPVSGQTYDYARVKLSEHFYLSELVGTEVDQGWSTRVLVQPALVEALENFRQAVGMTVSINSGYRSPLHQEAICKDMCGNPMGCPGTCANNSRHMFGDAADLPKTFYSYAYGKKACEAGFRFAYAERCTHLHVDVNPHRTSCSVAFDECN